MKNDRPPITPGKVLIAWVHQDWVGHNFLLSLLEAMAAMPVPWTYTHTPGNTGQLAQARNQLARVMLDSDAEWMWCVDTDAGFTADTYARLAEVAHPEHRPIVGALAYAQRKAARDGMNGWITQPEPVLMKWADADPPVMVLHEGWEPGDLVEVDGTGCHCLLIHRSVLEDIGPGGWFHPIGIEGADGHYTLSEDLSFCLRAQQANHSIWVATGVRTNHLKSAWV